MNEKEINYETLKHLTDGLANLQTQVDSLQRWMQGLFQPNTNPYQYYGAGAQNQIAMANANLNVLRDAIKTNAEQVGRLKPNEDPLPKSNPSKYSGLPF